MNSLRNVTKRKLKEAAHIEMLKIQHEWLEDMTDQIFAHFLVCLIGVFEQRGRSEKYIKDFIKDFRCIMSVGNLFGKQVVSNDLQKLYSEKYGINFEEIHVHIEDEKAFIKRNS